MWWLALASVLFALLLAGPAWWVAGGDGLLGLAIATALCLLPGCLAMTLHRLVGDQSGMFELAVGGLRMLFVAAGAVAMQVTRPDLGMREFYVWLILLYVFTLAVETTFILKGMGRKDL